MKTHYKITAAYDGSTYNGWQRLGNNTNTIQETIENVLSEIFNESIEIRGSGRTDAGVHALGQVFDFKVNGSLPTDRLIALCNSSLPVSIRFNEICEVSDEFHSRLSAASKIYEYHIDTRNPASVFNRRYSYRLENCQHISPALNITAMKAAAAKLIGTHDFRSFTSDKDLSKSSIRTITSIDIIKSADNITLRYTGNGFLYNMVRILSGTLVEVGLEKMSPDNIDDILASKNRSNAGSTLPPEGLFLVKVLYSDLS